MELLSVLIPLQMTYSISKPATTSLKVYDISGKEVKVLLNKHQTIGTYKLEFDASSLPDGIYFCKIFIDT